MKNKHLVMVFVGLLIIWGLSSYFLGNRNKNFEANIITVDTTKITSISIRPKGELEEILLKKEGETWIASKGALIVNAVPRSISMVFEQLAAVNANRIVAKTPDKWLEYEVTDSLGTVIRIFENEQLKEELVVGRFSFNQTAQTGTSFVRLLKGAEVYATDGFLAIAFAQGFDLFRDRSFVDLQPADIQEISIFEADSLTGIFAKKPDGNWQNAEGKTLDSLKISGYLNGISKLRGSEFADDFDPTVQRVGFHKSLKIKTKLQDEAIQIGCLLDTFNRDKPFLFNSSQHAKTWFLSDSAGLFRQVFPDWKSFLSEKKK